MADDTFESGGGSAFITSSGVVVSQENMPKIMKTGMLRDKKNKFSEFFFVLRGDTRELLGYKAKVDDPANTKETPKLKFSLADCHGIKPVADKKYPFSFEVELGKKVYVFACDAPDERESWMHHLRRFAVLHGKD